jgi:hypothetical protein
MGLSEKSIGQDHHFGRKWKRQIEGGIEYESKNTFNHGA